MPGKRRGRTARGWDAAPPRNRTAASPSHPSDVRSPEAIDPENDLDEDGWPRGSVPAPTRYGGGSDSGGRGRSDGGTSGSRTNGSRTNGSRTSGSRTSGGRTSGSRTSGSDERGSGPRRSAPGRGRDQSGYGEPDQDPAERAREICLRLLAARPRTRVELAKALRQQGIATAVAAEVLSRYAEAGIIDDQAFARAWVSSRHHGRGLARRALATELRQRGVDDEASRSRWRARAGGHRQSSCRPQAT